MDLVGQFLLLDHILPNKNILHKLSMFYIKKCISKIQTKDNFNTLQFNAETLELKSKQMTV